MRFPPPVICAMLGSGFCFLYSIIIWDHVILLSSRGYDFDCIIVQENDSVCALCVGGFVTLCCVA